MIPGIGISAFAPKIRNYADIGLVYKRTSLGYTTASYSTYTIGSFANDSLLLFFVESVSTEDPIGTTGYVKISSIAGNGTTLSIYYKICDGSSNNLYFSTIVGHFTHYYCVYSNVDITDPINVYGTSKQDTTTTSLNAPAVTTTRNKCLVVNATGVRFQHFMGNGASAWANSYLSSFAEFCDYAGNVGAIVIATGFMVTAGNTGQIGRASCRATV